MTTTPHGQVPEPLRLADEFKLCSEFDSIPSIIDIEKAEAELRRLHAENEALRAQQPAPAGAAPLPLLVRDIAADFGVTPVQVCLALVELGFGHLSVNMAITPKMAEQLREHFAATPQPAPATQQAGASVTVGVGSQEFDLAETGAHFTTADMATACGQAFREGQAAQQTVEVALDATMRAIQQAIGLIGEPDSDRLRAVRRVLRGAVIVVEDTAPQPSPTAQAAESVTTECGNCFEGKSDFDHVCKKCGGSGKAAESTPAVADAMADSQYLAGVSAGWNAANADDQNAALQKLHESRAGYLKPLSAARAQEESVGRDAARYRAFIDCGQPICFMGEEYFGKQALDAAIDAARSRAKEGA